MQLPVLEISMVGVVAVVIVIATLAVLLRPKPDAKPIGVELGDIFGEPSGPYPGPKARRWALGVLFEAGVDADADKAYAVGILRASEPRLSAAAARALVDAVDLS